MAKYKQTRARTVSSAEIALRLQMMQSPEIKGTVERLYARYGKYAVPVAELRKMLDKDMGTKTLKEELYAMREGR
jgi:hypothetical protein